jgi:hypothetical protein
MGGFLAGPFTGAAPPLFPQKMRHDVSEQDCGPVAAGPPLVGGIVGVPHAQRAVGVAVWRFGRPVGVGARHGGVARAEHDGHGLLDQVGQLQPHSEGEASSMPSWWWYGAHGDSVSGELMLEQDAGCRPGVPGRHSPRRWHAEARRLAAHTGNRQEWLHAEVFKALLDQSKGDHATAVSRLGELLPELRRIGDRRCEIRCLQGLGRAAMHNGDREHARDFITEAADIAESLGSESTTTELHRLIAES